MESKIKKTEKNCQKIKSNTIKFLLVSGRLLKIYWVF